MRACAVDNDPGRVIGHVGNDAFMLSVVRKGDCAVDVSPLPVRHRAGIDQDRALLLSHRGLNIGGGDESAFLQLEARCVAVRVQNMVLHFGG